MRWRESRRASFLVPVLLGAVAGPLLGLGGCNRAGRAPAENTALSPTAVRPGAKPAAAPVGKSAVSKADVGAATDMQAMFDAIDKLPPASAGATSPGQPGHAGAEPAMSLETSASPAPSAEPAPRPIPTLVATTRVVAEPPASPPAAPATGSPQPEVAPAQAQSESAPLSPPQAIIARTTVVDTSTTPAAMATPDRPAPPAVVQALSIPTVALCQRVESFGRYLPFPTTKFLAGKPALMIVYTEVDGFTQSPIDDPSGLAQYVTELAQSLELYLDSDGSRQMVIPEQSVREVTRGKRRDFFLVQRLELPRTLSVGKYNLKVRVTDAANSQQVERSVRIEIVADPSAVTERRGRENPGVITPESASAGDRQPARVVGGAREGRK